MGKTRAMTEELWLKSRDLKRLFAHLGKPTKLVKNPSFRRKSRLFGVAAITHSWRGLAVAPVLQTALELAEKFADGNASAWEVASVRAAVQADRTLWEFSLAVNCVTHEDDLFTGYEAAHHAVVVPQGTQDRYAHIIAVTTTQASLFRDIFGNPFRPVAFDSAWRTSTVAALAQGMYDSRDFSAMPILADALQDAGCECDDILKHCRDVSAPHVSGCWVVDLVLEK